MTPQEHAEELREAVRHVPGGGEQHLEALLDLAQDAETNYRKGREDVAIIVRGLADAAWEQLSNDRRDRQVLLETLITNLRRVTS